MLPHTLLSQHNLPSVPLATELTELASAQHAHLDIMLMELTVANQSAQSLTASHAQMMISRVASVPAAMMATSW